MRRDVLAYTFCRLLMGFVMLGHGLVRIPKLEAFSQWMEGQFIHSALPMALVQPFSYILPFAEFFIGFLLIIGLFTRVVLVTAIATMLMLIFGSTLIEQWENASFQLLYGLIQAGLFYGLNKNVYSADYYLFRYRFPEFSEAEGAESSRKRTTRPSEQQLSRP